MKPACAMVAAIALTVAATLPAGAAPVWYVALGDSYTAAPGVPPPAPGAPLDCFQSAANYPHLTAAALRFTLTDRSCNSATTANLTTAQYPDQPPQLDSLQPSTALVTIGIGGNDNQLFVGALVTCSLTDVADFLDLGAPCQSLFGSRFIDQANADGPVVGQALATIHARSPHARVFVVGYPDILPQAGRCYPQLPLTTGDVAYLNQVELALNAMLQREAAAHGAAYVDTFTPSLGHDACQAVGTRWVEPLLPGAPTFPIHPNTLGEAADATALVAALHSAAME